MSASARIQAEKQPHAIALSDGTLSFTWAQLNDTLNRAVNALLAMPLGPDRRAAVFARNSAETVLAYLTCLHAGVSATPASWHLTADELTYILEDSNAKVLFVGPENLEIGAEAARRVGAAVVGWRCPPGPDVIAWESWLAAASPAEPPADMKPLPYLQYTSGTTGRPKAVDAVATTLAPAATVAQFFEELRARPPFSPDGVHMVVGPLYHNGPLNAVRVLGAGIPVVVLPRFDPEEVLRVIDRYRVATTVMVPTHFQRLLALPPEVRPKYAVSSLRTVAHTGAACPRDVKRSMIEWFGPVLTEAYGGTECGTTNVITSEEWLKHPGSVGKTLEGFELQVIGDDGRMLGPNEVGQLYFRDKSGRGIIYRNDPEKTRSVHLRPGVFTLGELGYYDDDGYVYITDRVADLIVSGGVNIYPAEIEQVLLTHPQVADVVAIGVPNAEMGEEVKALVIPRDPAAPPSAEELTEFCRSRLAGFKCPRTVDFVSDVGRNALGKVNKRALRAPYWPTDRTIGG
jgi:acyl-CoA synthetase (AMP-forming)/AMP-acid ligase II